MFVQKADTLLFLTDTSLRVAEWDQETTRFKREEIFVFDETGISGALQKVADRFGTNVRLVIPEKHLYVTSLDLDGPENHIRSNLEQKILEIFPEDMASIAWDYKVIESHPHCIQVELSGVERRFGETLNTAIKQTGFSLQALIPESYALAHLVEDQGVSLLLHESEGGWIVAFLYRKDVIISLFLRQLPTEKDLQELIAYGLKRKNINPSRMIISCHSKADAIPTLDMPRAVLETSLDPLLGAAKIVLRSLDGERLDLPLRGQKKNTLTRFLDYIFGFIKRDFLRSYRKGFTLPEILVVVGIIAILAAIVIIAIDPTQRFEDARNSRRLSDTQAILSALHQYTIDHRGTLPEGLEAREKQIGTAHVGCTLNTNQCHVQGDADCIDLTTTLDPYLHGIPSDPGAGTSDLTHYSVHMGANNAIIVQACDLSKKEQ